MSEKKQISPAQKKKRYAKYAMAASMGVLVVSGMYNGKTARTVHTLSGIALVGLSVYHTYLYKNRS